MCAARKCCPPPAPRPSPSVHHHPSPHTISHQLGATCWASMGPAWAARWACMGLAWATCWACQCLCIHATRPACLFLRLQVQLQWGATLVAILCVSGLTALSSCAPPFRTKAHALAASWLGPWLHWAKIKVGRGLHAWLRGVMLNGGPGPTPYTLHPTPCSLLPASCSLLPTPCSLLPAPSALAPFQPCAAQVLPLA